MLAAAAALMILCPEAAPRAAPDAREVAAILRACEREPPSAEALAARLAALGPAAIPHLFSVLVQGLDGRDLGALAEEGLLGALGSFGAPALRPFLERLLRSGAGSEERFFLLRLLARIGSSQDLALARRATGSAQQESLGSALEEAVEGILRRDPRGLEPVRRWILASPADVGAGLVRAAGASGCGAALPMLAELLGQEPALDPVLLPEIGRLAERSRKPIDEKISSALARALESEDPRLLREAALALGRAEDSESLPRLVELLEHEDRGVREAASRALERSTGLRFRGDPVRWSSLLRAEARWFEQEVPELPARLSSREPGIAVRALGEVSAHRYRRHQLAQEVELALEHESPLVRGLACLTLARLSSSAALPALHEVLEDPDEGVARAAREALAALGEPVEEGGEP